MRNIHTLYSKLGPGILLATAAVGGSHLVASTQAGAIFGWQLFWLILIVNILKYPFFKFAVDFTLQSKTSLIEGYKSQGNTVFYAFIGLSILAAIVNTAGVLLLTASLLHYALPIPINITILCLVILLVCLLIILIGQYSLLDNVSKVIMLVLTVMTLCALLAAFINGPQMHIQAPDPFSFAMIGFLVVLMGWMPAPIEISAINSLWLKEKINSTDMNTEQGIFDFNVGYTLTTVLALVFFALGVLVQFGSQTKIELAGVAFSKQLIDMYTLTIGQWSKTLVSSIAFLAMFGTTITVLDGYARALNEAVKLTTIRYQKTFLWIVLTQATLGLGVILFFKSNLKDMLTFAMTLAFITTPIFAWFNYKLILNQGMKLSFWMKGLTYIGLIYLFGFASLFIIWKLSL